MARVRVGNGLESLRNLNPAKAQASTTHFSSLPSNFSTDQNRLPPEKFDSLHHHLSTTPYQPPNMSDEVYDGAIGIDLGMLLPLRARARARFVRYLAYTA